MNLKKIVILKNVLDILTDYEMKSTIAGYGGNYCYPGESMYYCRDINGLGGPGNACGTDGIIVGLQVTWDQCKIYRDILKEPCPYSYFCSH